MIHRTAVFVAVLLSATAAVAQPPDLGNKPRWSLGVAVISSPEPYVPAYEPGSALNLAGGVFVFSPVSLSYAF
jgi:hypothetical protein